MDATLILTNNFSCRLPKTGEKVEAGHMLVCLLSSGLQCPESGSPELYGVLGVKGFFRHWYDSMGMLQWEGRTLSFTVKDPEANLYTKLVELSLRQTSSRQWIYFGIFIEETYDPGPQIIYLK